MTSPSCSASCKTMQQHQRRRIFHACLAQFNAKPDAVYMYVQTDHSPVPLPLPYNNVRVPFITSLHSVPFLRPAKGGDAYAHCLHVQSLPRPHAILHCLYPASPPCGTVPTSRLVEIVLHTSAQQDQSLTLWVFRKAAQSVLDRPLAGGTKKCHRRHC